MGVLYQLVAPVMELVTWSLLAFVAYSCVGGGWLGLAAAVVGLLAALAASWTWILERSSRRRRARALALRVIMFGSAAVGLAALGYPWLAVLYVLVVLGTHVGATFV